MTISDREGLLTTLRERRKLYLWIYFTQTIGWLVAVIIYETTYAERGPAIKHAIDTAVTMSFIAPGVFVSTIFLVDVVIDGIHSLVKKGWILMGLLFSPEKIKNRWEERGKKQARAESAAWYARLKQAEKDGRDFNEPPPFLDDK